MKETNAIVMNFILRCNIDIHVYTKQTLQMITSMHEMKEKQHTDTAMMLKGPIPSIKKLR